MRHGIAYQYLRDEHNNPAVALIFSTEENNPRVKFQIATRSTRDPFVKKVARMATHGRLDTHPIEIEMPSTDFRHGDVVRAIADALVGTNFVGTHNGPITRQVVSRYTTEANAFRQRVMDELLKPTVFATEINDALAVNDP